jgi:hypothetical protein
MVYLSLFYDITEAREDKYRLSKAVKAPSLVTRKARVDPQVPMIMKWLAGCY